MTSNNSDQVDANEPQEATNADATGLQSKPSPILVTNKLEQTFSAVKSIFSPKSKTKSKDTANNAQNFKESSKTQSKNAKNSIDSNINNDDKIETTNADSKHSNPNKLESSLNTVKSIFSHKSNKNGQQKLEKKEESDNNSNNNPIDTNYIVIDANESNPTDPNTNHNNSNSATSKTTNEKDANTNTASTHGIAHAMKGIKFGSNIKKLGQKIDDRLTMPGLLKQARITLEYWLITQSKKPNKNTKNSADESKTDGTKENDSNIDETDNINIDSNANDTDANESKENEKLIDKNDYSDYNTYATRSKNGLETINGVAIDFAKMPPFACGIVLLSTVSGGFIHGAEGSTGIVMIRLDKGYETDEFDTPIQRWSQPCAIAGGGASFGFQIGFSKIDQLIILTHPRHVKTFMGVENDLYICIFCLYLFVFLCGNWFCSSLFFVLEVYT